MRTGQQSPDAAWILQTATNSSVPLLFSLSRMAPGVSVCVFGFRHEAKEIQSSIKSEASHVQCV